MSHSLPRIKFKRGFAQQNFSTHAFLQATYRAVKKQQIKPNKTGQNKANQPTNQQTNQPNYQPNKQPNNQTTKPSTNHQTARKQTRQIKPNQTKQFFFLCRRARQWMRQERAVQSNWLYKSNQTKQEKNKQINPTKLTNQLTHPAKHTDSQTNKQKRQSHNENDSYRTIESFTSTTYKNSDAKRNLNSSNSFFNVNKWDIYLF